jgi:hypothetical protein
MTFFFLVIASKGILVYCFDAIIYEDEKNEWEVEEITKKNLNINVLFQDETFSKET